VPFWLASALLVALDVALLLAILVVVVRAAPLHAVAGVRLDAAALLGPALWTEPVRTTFDYGQVNVILLALVLVDAFVLPPRWRGVGTGIAAAIKIVPAFYGLYWLLTRQWRPAVTMVVTALTATALAALVAPSDSVRYWTETLFQTQRVGPLWYTSNQSLRATYVRLLGDGTVAELLWLGSAAIVVALTIALARRRSVAGPCLATLTAVGLASLLVAPISWSHHWVWFLPACVLLAARLESRIARAALPVALLASFAAPHWLMPHEDDRELRWSALEWVAGSVYPALAVLLLVVIGGAPAHRPASSEPSPASAGHQA
jgi:alpha-1,2-mannosyltransferase